MLKFLFVKASRVPPESGSRRIGRKALSTTAAPGTTKPPSTKKPAIKRSSDRPNGVKEALSPVDDAKPSPLATKIIDRMVKGLKTPQGVEPDFDLAQLDKAVAIFPQIDANAAEDDSFAELRALFRIGTNGDVPPFNAIEALIEGLNQVNSFEKFDPKKIEEAYKTLFINAAGYEDGTPGQLLVASIGQVIDGKEITANLEPYKPQLKALYTFLKALQRLEV